MNANNSNSAHADREIVISRVINAPRELVFEAWTNKDHVDKWWGPNGFRNSTKHMDVRVGGSWDYVMHGPDGKDYDNLVTYLEVERPGKLVYWHGEPSNPEQFYVTVTFREQDGKTEVTMCNLFPTKEAKDFVIREVGAIEGGNQTMDRLVAYVRSM